MPHTFGVLKWYRNVRFAVTNQYQAVLPAVAEACFAVAGEGEKGMLKGAQVLEMLHERSHFGAPDVSESVPIPGDSAYPMRALAALFSPMYRFCDTQ